MLKKIGMVIVGATLVVAHCLIGGTAFADSYTQDGKPCPPECVSDSMEIVTWYPSPYNEYEELRLYPISESNSPNGECGQDNRGLMYYDKDDDKVYICKGAIEGWKELGGSGNLPQSTTSSSFCDSNNLGKLIYDTSRNRPYVCALNGSSYVWKPLDSDYDEDGITDAVDANDNDFNDATATEANVEIGKTFYARGGSRRTGTMAAATASSQCNAINGYWDATNKLCWFSGSSCPTNWRQQSNYSTTTANTCTWTACCRPVPCTTGSHWRMDKASETCTYYACAAPWNSSWRTWCDEATRACWGCILDTWYYGSFGAIWSWTCNANITEVGCIWSPQ